MPTVATNQHQNNNQQDESTDGRSCDDEDGFVGRM